MVTVQLWALCLVSSSPDSRVDLHVRQRTA